ncbi:hypothetical protein MSAN_01546300 [Mycena sanguinolenta]|uniref:F-box domain-containing protein n=1 Tax=Mycena sanguinolenta TaxID=230812 RepID=A0A8H7CZE1_9AGAR|nr:hypothetical protein MSAN_01546300 [Mycena sanguinolenta]
MPFDAFGEDVLLEILFFCDISTVLAVSAVSGPTLTIEINKTLRRIAMSKQLWLSQVLDTRFREALELPPPSREKLECLSTEELIAVNLSSVTMTNVRIPLDDMERRPEARLLPGARYILLHNASVTQQTLCIYDIWSARRVWERPVQVHTMCQVDLVPGGTIARICLAQPGDIPTTQTVRVHIEEVQLTTAFATLDHYVLSWATFSLGTVPHPHSYFNDTLVLINWRASIYVSLGRVARCPVTIPPPHRNLEVIRLQVRLIPGYILSTHQVHSPPPARGHILAATALKASSDRWQSLADEGAGLAARLGAGSAATMTINNVNITTQERLEYNGRPMMFESVSVTPDALYVGAYDISVFAPQFLEPPPPPRSVTLMERIGNIISNMAGTARRGKARPVLTQAMSAPAQAVLRYRFTPAVPAAGEACSLRLVSARRVSDRAQANCPRAIISFSQGNSINVVYRERKITTAAVDAA